MKETWSLGVYNRSDNKCVRILHNNLKKKDALDLKKWIIQDGNWYQHNNCGYYLYKHEKFSVKKNILKKRHK
jgi:hypothetical protein